MHVTGAIFATVFTVVGSPHNQVMFTQAPTCISQSDVAEALTAAMNAAAKSREIDLLIVASETVEAADIRITMKAITGSGEVVLERSYGIVRADCENAPALLQTVLARFLESFPIEKWTLAPEQAEQAIPPPSPEPEPEPKPKPKPRAEAEAEASTSDYWRWTLAVAGNADLNPMGGSGDISLTWDFGSQHRFIAGIMERVAAPADVGSGQFWNFLTAVVVGWGYRADRWMPRASVVVGGLRLVGTGFGRNSSSWVPWAELDLAAPYRLTEHLFVGPRAGLSPIFRNATDEDGNSRRQVPNIRLGLGLWFDFGEQKQ